MSASGYGCAGCGAGRTAARAAARCRTVDAVDRSPAMVAAARAAVPGNVRVVEGDLLSVDLPGGYDAVVSGTALHHLPLEPALERLGLDSLDELPDLAPFLPDDVEDEHEPVHG